jgi:hypothetical protein
MRKPVSRRVDVSASAYGWDTSYTGREIYQKDGYEIYFFQRNEGFELTIRDPETRERETVLEVRDDEICTASPAYVALLEHTIKNAENIVAELTE